MCFSDDSLGNNCFPGGVLWKLFYISVYLIRESRIANKMPSTKSHMYSQAFNSCPVLFSLVLEPRSPPPCSLPGTRLLCCTGSVTRVDSVLSGEGRLAGVTH